VTLLLLYVGIAVGISFLCSLLEATLLSARSSNLREQSQTGNRGAAILLEIKQTRLDDAISAILALNTVSNTLGATLAGAQAARVFGSNWVGVFSGVLTFVILVISEIIPKTLGAVYARTLSPGVGHALEFLTRVMLPFLFVSRALTRLLTRGRRTTLSRGEIAAVIDSATEEGAISDSESKMLSNLLRFNEVQVEDVMTPRSVTFMLPVETTVDELLRLSDAEIFSRVPLYRDDRDNVIGYILQREVLAALAQRGDRKASLESFMRPISFVPEVASVGQALSQILQRREPIAMVTDEHGGVEGLVTLEDLTETILGVEIVDESDRIADMREAATLLRRRRLARVDARRRSRDEPSAAEDDAVP